MGTLRFFKNKFGDETIYNQKCACGCRESFFAIQFADDKELSFLANDVKLNREQIRELVKVLQIWLEKREKEKEKKVDKDEGRGDDKQKD